MILKFYKLKFQKFKYCNDEFFIQNEKLFQSKTLIPAKHGQAEQSVFSLNS